MKKLVWEMEYVNRKYETCVKEGLKGNYKESYVKKECSNIVMGPYLN